MTERMGGCEGPEGSDEAYASCQMPTEGLDPSASDEGGLNADHEMQWLSARENTLLQAPSLDGQLFITLPQGLGAGLLGGPPSEPCEELPNEACEEMSREPAEPAYEEMCTRESPEASFRGRHHGLLPSGTLCQAPSERSLYEEGKYGEPWAGKARLPSIVVEPSEGEVESGELRWPPESVTFLEEEDEDPDSDELFAEGEEVLETGLSSFDSDVEEVLL